MRVRVALEAEAERLAAEAKAVEAKQSAAESAARLKESEQKLQEIKKQKTAEPPAWMTSGAIAPAAPATPGTPPAQTQTQTQHTKSAAPGVPVPPSASELEARVAETLVTPETPPRRAPHDRVQTPTGNGRELLIQCFNWESARKKGAWYRTVTELAPRRLSSAEMLDGGDASPYSPGGALSFDRPFSPPTALLGGDVRAFKAFGRHPAVVALRGNCAAAVKFAPELKRPLRHHQALAAAARAAVVEADNEASVGSSWDWACRAMSA